MTAIDLRGVRMLATVASFFPRVGGGELYAQRYLQGLADLGARVDVLTNVAGIVGSRDVGTLRVHYLETRRVAGFPVFALSAIDRYARRSRATVLQTVAPAAHDFPVALYARLRRLPLIAIYHADLKDNRGVGRVATALHNRLVLRSAARVLTTNARLATRLIGRGIEPEKIVDAPPGVDERFFDAPPRSDVDLLFVGALDGYHEYKRLDLLLDAVARLRAAGDDVRLSVVGSGDRLQHFVDRAAARGIDEAVRFHGHVHDDELPSYYAGASALVLPSPTTQEGFGLVCLESIASGTPVVCSAQAGASSIVAGTPGCAVWDGHSSGDLDRAIRVARSASLQTRLEIARIGRGYSWESMTAHFARRIFPSVAA